MVQDPQTSQMLVGERNLIKLLVILTTWNI